MAVAEEDAVAVVVGDVDFGAWGSRMHCSPVAVGIHRPDSSWLLLLGWIMTQKESHKKPVRKYR